MEGMSEEDYNIAYDLGMHAARQAFVALVRVLDTAPKKVNIEATAIAHAQMLWQIAAIDEQMDVVDPGFKKLVEDSRDVIARTSGPKFAKYARKGIDRVFGSMEEMLKQREAQR